MRLGCCAGLDSIETVRDAGYDFIELGVSCARAESPDSEFEAVRDRLQSAEIVPEVWNCLLMSDMKPVGPEVDIYRIERFLRTAFDRIEELGGEIVVFGSGRARTVPEGFPSDEARDQLVRFLSLAGQVAGAHGITIAVEPLNLRETNCINSVAQAVEVVRAVDHPFVKVLVDLYHMMMDDEPLSAIAAASGEIVHAHIADTGRLHPGSGSYPSKEFIDALKAAGYDGRLSIEGGWSDFDSECRKALEFLRSLTAN